jgi:hypothetical protein
VPVDGFDIPGADGYDVPGPGHGFDVPGPDHGFDALVPSASADLDDGFAVPPSFDGGPR